MPTVSERCFGPYETQPATAPWMARYQVLHRCKNPAHPPHFVDTRTGLVVTCGESSRVSRVDVGLVQVLLGDRYRDRCHRWGGTNPWSFHTCSQGHTHLHAFVVA